MRRATAEGGELLAAGGGGEAGAGQHVEEQLELAGESVGIHGGLLCVNGKAIVRGFAFPGQQCLRSMRLFSAGGGM